MLRILLLLLGVFSCSCSVLLIKGSSLHPSIIAAHRLLLAALILSPLYLFTLKKHREQYTARHVRLVIFPAFLMAMHFITWAQGAKMTHAANATLIANLIPVAIPIILFLIAREVPTRWEIIGTVIAVAGAILVAASDFHVSMTNVWGDAICFGSMIFFAYYLVQGRVSREIPSIWLFLVPLYAFAGLFCFLVSLVIANPFVVPSRHDFLMSLGLAVIPTVSGHSLLNFSMKHMRSQVVSVVNLSQFIFAGTLAYLIFHEKPQTLFYVASTCVVSGAIVVINAHAKEHKPSSDEPLEPGEEAAPEH